MKREITFVHASPAAIPPLMQFYGQEAPELEITNLLDDGILRLFAAQQMDSAEMRLADMLSVARGTYGAEMALLTCSAVPREAMSRLRAKAGIPVIKIDELMAEQAVRAGEKLGLVVTFPPTVAIATRLIEEAAKSTGRSIELVPCLVAEAYEAILNGNPERHDALLLEAIDGLTSQSLNGIVLSQVSMARILPKLKPRVSIPVFTSLTASLEAIRHEIMGPRETQ